MFNFWNWEENPELIGIYAGQYKSVGKFKKNVYIFRVGGKTYHSWALVQLNNILYGVPFRTKVKIRYLGFETMPDSKRKFKNFDIEILGDAGKELKEDNPPIDE